MSTKLKPRCPSCGGKTPDWLLCGSCTDSLRADLELILPRPAVPAAHSCDVATRVHHWHPRQTLPWESQRTEWAGLVAELTLSMARQSKHAPNLAGGRSTELPLPYASPASTQLRRLRHWARDLGPLFLDPNPPITVTGLAGWLLDNLDVIRAHPDAAEIHSRISAVVARCLTVISPADREHRELPPLSSADLTEALDRLATRSEIITALSDPKHYGVTCSQSRFSNWVAAERILPKGWTAGEQRYPLYRLGDAVTLARETRGRRGAKRITLV
jgi:hypothetical protein